MHNEITDPIRGQTFLFTFDDGPMTGKTYEHAFGFDGKVTYRDVGGAPKQAGAKQPEASAKPAKYEVERVGDDVYAVAYLGDGGYTLTSVLDFKTRHLTGFASNEKSLVVQHGSFEATRPPMS